MSEEYDSYLKYEMLMEDEELSSMLGVPDLSPADEAVVQLISEILDRFDSETKVDRTTTFNAIIGYLMRQEENEINYERIATALTTLLGKVLDEEREESTNEN